MFAPDPHLSPDVAELAESLCDTYQAAFDDLDHADLAAFIREEQRIRKLYRAKAERIAAGSDQ